MPQLPSPPAIGRLATVLFAVFVISRLAFLVPPFQQLLNGEGGVDLQARRAELEWTMHGVNPEAARRLLLFESLKKSGEKPWLDPSTLPTKEEISVGRFTDGDFSSINPHLAAYPSWCYPLLAPMIWPPWPATTGYFTAVLVLSLAAFLWLCVRVVDRSWRWVALFVCLIPMSAYSASVFTGQVTIPAMLVIAGYGLMLHKQRWEWAGVLLAISAFKPTMSVLFAVALLAQVVCGRARLTQAVKAVAICASILLSSTLLVWWLVGTNPVAAQVGVVGGNSDAAAAGYGVLPLVVAAGLSNGTATLALAALGLGVAATVPWLMRHYTLLCQFAVLGVLSRLWTYHRHYDDLLLVFLLLALLVEVRRGSLLSLVALVLMAMTLATPTPTSTMLELWRVGVWLMATGALLIEARGALLRGTRGLRSDAEPAQP